MQASPKNPAPKQGPLPNAQEEGLSEANLQLVPMTQSEMSLTVRGTNSQALAPFEFFGNPISSTDRPTTLFTTWSHAKIEGRRTPGNSSRSEFAAIIDDVIRSLPEPPRVVGIAVFQEHHRSGELHLHAVVQLDRKWRRAHMLPTALSTMHKIFAHVATAMGSKPLGRMLEYCMVPSLSKMEVDREPFVRGELVIPEVVIDKAKKAFRKLERGTASNHEAFEYLRENTRIRTCAEFVAAVDRGEGESMQVGRLSRFISHNIHKIEGTIDLLIKRRDAPKMLEEAKLTPRQYLVQKIISAGTCQCPPGQMTVQQDIDALCHFHGIGNTGPFFAWANLFLTDSLVSVGRPKNSLCIGCPGSGKTTLEDLVNLILPQSRVHVPCPNAGTPFSGLSKTHLLSATTDWRLTSKIPISETLQWMEGRPFVIDIKNKEPAMVEKGPPCMHSANHLKPAGPWQQVDVEAYKDRCFVSYLVNPYPQHLRHASMELRMKRCPFCCMAALAKRCPDVAALCPKEWSTAQSSEGPSLQG